MCVCIIHVCYYYILDRYSPDRLLADVNGFLITLFNLMTDQGALDWLLATSAFFLASTHVFWIIGHGHMNTCTFAFSKEVGLGHSGVVFVS